MIDPTGGLWGALVLGIAGSLHCVGMCGPLILALPGNAARPMRFLLMRTAYHIGRSGIYALFGGMAGMFGYNLRLVGLQQATALLGGLLLLSLVLLPRFRHSIPLLQTIWSGLQPVYRRLFMRSGIRGQLLAGAFNAFLPCGLLYTALAAAAVLSHPLYSALFMGIFGLATLPALLALSFARSSFRWRPGRWSAHVGTAFTLLLGIWMVLRGLGLGIPMLSPDLKQQGPASPQGEFTHSQAPSCH
jgi:sulfite exporter TauE/SafE